MIFTGKNLAVLRDALERAVQDVRTDVAHAPDMDADELGDEAKRYKKLLYGVNEKLKEKKK